METHKNQKVLLSIGLASALGAAIGGMIAISLWGTFWWLLGPVVSALAVYLTHQPAEVWQVGCQTAKEVGSRLRPARWQGQDIKLPIRNGFRKVLLTIAGVGYTFVFISTAWLLAYWTFIIPLGTS